MVLAVGQREEHCGEVGRLRWCWGVGVGYGQKRQAIEEKEERCDNEKPIVPQQQLPLLASPNPPSRDQSGLNQSANQRENVLFLPQQPEQDNTTRNFLLLFT